MRAASTTTTQDRRSEANTPLKWRTSTIENSKTSRSMSKDVYDGVHALSAFGSERANGTCRMHFHGGAQDMYANFTACRAASCTLVLYVSSRAGFVVRSFNQISRHTSDCGHVT